MSLDAPYIPVPITGLRAFFPDNVMEDLMPAREVIPDSFWRNTKESEYWRNLQAQWFFGGIKSGIFIAKDGIDKAMALRHLGAIQGSFEPRHEYKEAAVAWLMSLWFERQ